MKFSTYLTIWGVITGAFAIGLLFFPVQLLAQYGSATDEEGILLARFYGAMLAFVSLINFVNRGAPLAEKSWFGLLLAGILINVVAGGLMAYAISRGLANALGWGSVVLYLIYAAGNAYYLMQRSKLSS